MEQLKHKNDIEIKLLQNRCFLYANRKQNIVITAEHLATEITVLFPDEYENYSKRVDFVNSQGKEWTEGLYTPEFKCYKPGVHKSRFHFSLPTEVTTEGELKMQFLAYLPDESMITVPFEVIPIYVQNGLLAFKRSSRSNPDLLILSANKSEQALFNSQKALAKSQKAVETADEAKQTAKNADEKSNFAIKSAGNAEKSAAQAVEVAVKANEASGNAVDMADEANKNSAEALKTANEAEDKAKNAVQTAINAEDKANEACESASNALENSEDALNQSSNALEKAESAVETAESTMDAAEKAEKNSEIALEQSADALDLADQANVASIEAKDFSETAIQTANEATDIARTAEEKAQSIVDRANSGEFKGEKGDQGNIGPPGQDGFTFAIDNFIGLHVDENGEFFAYAGDTANIDFRYDEESGNLYLVFL